MLVLVKSISEDTPDPNAVGVVPYFMEYASRGVFLLGDPWDERKISHMLHAVWNEDHSSDTYFFDNDWFIKLKSI